MKKKNKKNHIRMRFSTLLLCILAILLCDAPCGARDVESGEILNVGTGMDVERIDDDYLKVKGGTVNLYPGAYVDYGIFAYDGSTVNIYAGELGAYSYIMLLGDNSTASTAVSTAVVTVYGTEFKVDDYPCDYGKVTLTGGSGTLTGKYDYYGDTSEIHLWILSNTPINLQPPPSSGLEEITIDIKPGSDDNSINLNSKGVVPVAVLTTGDFDAGTIKPETVLFAGASPLRWTLRWKWKMMKDVDDDGDKDMLFFFRTQDLDLDENSTEATLTGIADGNEISGTDTVRIVPPQKKYHKLIRNRRNQGGRIVPHKK